MKKFKVCTVKVIGKDFEFDYEFEKLLLYSCSLIFHEQIDQNCGQTTFSFTNTQYDKKVYDLFFSEVPAINISKSQINQNS